VVFLCDRVRAIAALHAIAMAPLFRPPPSLGAMIIVMMPLLSTTVVIAIAVMVRPAPSPVLLGRAIIACITGRSRRSRLRDARGLARLRAGWSTVKDDGVHCVNAAVAVTCARALCGGSRAVVALGPGGALPVCGRRDHDAQDRRCGCKCAESHAVLGKYSDS
jgi:hypothetical protein